MVRIKTRTTVIAGFFLLMLGSEPSYPQTTPGARMQNSQPQPQPQLQPQPQPQAQGPIVTNCRIETQTFSSLRTGEVDFCKKHIKYNPGTPDCYVFETQVCDLFQPTTREWTQERRPLTPRAVECPEEPEPPLCPSSPSLRW